MSESQTHLEPTRWPYQYLEDALANAERDLREHWRGADFHVLARNAIDLVNLRLQLVSSRHNNPIEQELARLFFPGIDPAKLRESVLQLALNPSEWPSWIRFAVELVLLEEGIARIQATKARYYDFQAFLVEREVPEAAAGYLEELRGLYLFGFDRAVVAMAASAFEQLGRDALLATGKFSQPQLEREAPVGTHLLARLRQADLIAHAASAANRLLKNRNQVVHEGGLDGTELAAMSREALIDLVEIMKDLHPAWHTPIPVWDPNAPEHR